ncbi:MAG TPA: hypothetical protein VFE46_18420 [Pirellulales bacterium]|jgi:hypothetical protein|nr:hypothetical protein [Pirellulales bacterium]
MSQWQTVRCWKKALWGVVLAASCGLTGCMANYSGQNLPSPYYLSAQLQYYPPGPQFKLTEEAAAQKANRETQAQQQGPVPTEQ